MRSWFSFIYKYTKNKRIDNLKVNIITQEDGQKKNKSKDQVVAQIGTGSSGIQVAPEIAKL